MEETRKIASEWLNKISNNVSAGSSSKNPAQKAMVVGLSGDLGAGKTAFVKCIAKELGIKEEITSPTFVIIKNYGIDHGRFKKLVHVDAYRLQKSQELEVLGFNDLVSDPNNLVMLEWPENVEGVLPKDTEILTFEIGEGEGKRTIAYR